MNIRETKEATRTEYEAHKKVAESVADRLRAAGYVFRGNGPKVFDPFLARWIPKTDYWSKANSPKDEGIWLTRQDALSKI